MLSKRHLIPALKVLSILTLAMAMVYYPFEVLSSASQGIAAWSSFVLPALLPFFILSELLIGAGFMHFCGRMFERLIRPLFNLPGCSAFVILMGFTSGPPIGAALTVKLHKEHLISTNEAERLLAFTNNASPGFMLGAVAAGMFASPGLGIIFAISNHLASLLIGVTLGHIAPSRPNFSDNSPAKKLWLSATRELLKAQRNDARPLGQLIADSVRNSLNTVLAIGGFIVFFAVLLRLLNILGLIDLLGGWIGIILTPLSIDQSLHHALAVGLFEMTLGVKEAVGASASLVAQITAVSAIMAWSGISVLAQVASFTSGTTIRLTPFIISRLVHSILASTMVFTILHFIESTPVFSLLDKAAPLWHMEFAAIGLSVLAVLMLRAILAILVDLMQKIKSFW